MSYGIPPSLPAYDIRYIVYSIARNTTQSTLRKLFPKEPKLKLEAMIWLTGLYRPYITFTIETAMAAGDALVMSPEFANILKRHKYNYTTTSATAAIDGMITEPIWRQTLGRSWQRSAKSCTLINESCTRRGFERTETSHTCTLSFTRFTRESCEIPHKGQDCSSRSFWDSILQLIDSLSHSLNALRSFIAFTSSDHRRGRSGRFRDRAV